PGQARLDWARHLYDSGWQEPIVPVVTPEQRRRGVERDAQGHGVALARLRLGGPACRAQRDLLRLCRDRGIRAALLRMPESAVYRSWYPPAVRERLGAF